VESIGLEEAIRAVRQELTSAMAAAADEAIRFKVKSVQLEFQAVVTREAEAAGKVRFYVVDLGGGGKVGSASTHTIHVELDPVTADDGEVEVRGGEREKPA
jgi:Trypsin-co-occurring domain 2